MSLPFVHKEGAYEEKKEEHKVWQVAKGDSFRKSE